MAAPREAARQPDHARPQSMALPSAISQCVGEPASHGADAILTVLVHVLVCCLFSLGGECLFPLTSAARHRTKSSQW